MSECICGHANEHRVVLHDLIMNNVTDCDDYGNPLEDPQKEFGFGMMFSLNGRIGRVAIRVPKDITREIFVKAWKRLAHAIEHPMLPESKIAWEDSRLCGNEIELE